MTPDMDAVRVLAHSFVDDVLNRADTTLIPVLFADEYKDHDPLAPHSRGTGSIELLCRMLGQADVDVRFTIERFTYSDDLLTLAVFGSGTVPAETFPGLSDRRDGTYQLEVTTVSLFRIAHLKFRERWGPIRVRLTPLALGRSEA
jgi:predicted SnoaL-like aldol condensation-catalyzing enzyme